VKPSLQKEKSSTCNVATSASRSRRSSKEHLDTAPASDRRRQNRRGFRNSNRLCSQVSLPSSRPSQSQISCIAQSCCNLSISVKKLVGARKIMSCITSTAVNLEIVPEFARSPLFQTLSMDLDRLNSMIRWRTPSLFLFGIPVSGCNLKLELAREVIAIGTEVR